ncbi:MAG: hypothetical protein LBT14_08155 [Treponema sp.]|jgi:histidinol dehydrogenase|nr:hypothetical protein [Treponema sp.]
MLRPYGIDMMDIGAVENHRAREGGVLVYPVYSRRSQGLSVGINLFPNHKVCSFDCPYCEVFPFKGDTRFAVEAMETELRSTLGHLQAQGAVIKDMCFSGNGEPTLSRDFPEALKAAARIRDTAVFGAELVVITNGTGLLDTRTFNLLHHAATGHEALKIWLKLDAGTEGWYQEMARVQIPFETLKGKIKELVSHAPVTLQTMLCSVKGTAPPPEEAAAWESLVVELAGIGEAARKAAGSEDADGVHGETRGSRLPGIRDLQIYGKARPAPEDPWTEALPVSYLESRAASIRVALERAGLKAPSGKAIPVGVFP